MASQAATGNYAAGVAVATIPVKMQTPTVLMQLSAAETANVSSVTFEVDVAVTGRAFPTGSLEVLDGATVVGVYPLKATSGGVMRGVMPGSLGVGSHRLSAVYTGDSNYTSGSSAATLFTVDAKMAKLK